MRINDCLVARYVLESQFEMGNLREIFQHEDDLYCLINLELEKLMPVKLSQNMKTLLLLDWLMFDFQSRIYSKYNEYLTIQI